MGKYFRNEYRKNRKQNTREEGESRREFRQRMREKTALDMEKTFGPGVHTLDRAVGKYIGDAATRAAQNSASWIPAMPSPQTDPVKVQQVSNNLQAGADAQVKTLRTPGAGNGLAQRNIGYRQAFAKSQGLGNAYDASGNSVKGTSTADIKKIQQMLIDKGYDLGKTGADGLWGRKSQAAWDQYQKDQAFEGSPAGKAAADAAEVVGVKNGSKPGTKQHADNTRLAADRALATMYARADLNVSDSVPAAALDSAQLAFYKNPVALIDSLNLWARPDSATVRTIPAESFVQLPNGQNAYAAQGGVYYTPDGLVHIGATLKNKNLFTGETSRDTVSYNGNIYIPIGASDHINPNDSSYYDIRYAQPDSNQVVSYTVPQLMTQGGGEQLYNPADSVAYNEDSVAYINRGHGHIPYVLNDTTQQVGDTIMFRNRPHILNSDRTLQLPENKRGGNIKKRF